MASNKKVTVDFCPDFLAFPFSSIASSENRNNLISSSLYGCIFSVTSVDCVSLLICISKWPEADTLTLVNSQWNHRLVGCAGMQRHWHLQTILTVMTAWGAEIESIFVEVERYACVLGSVSYFLIIPQGSVHLNICSFVEFWVSQIVVNCAADRIFH